MAQPPRHAVSEFIAEANEILDALSRDLLALDEQRGDEPDPDHLNQVFRAAHTLKGLSGMFGQEAVAQLSHQMEDALDAVRMGKASLDDAVLDALIDALDALGALLRAAAEERDAPDVLERARHIGSRLTTLARVQSSRGPDLLDEAGIDQAVRSVLTEYEEHRLRENLKKGVGVWKLRAVFSLSDFDQRLAALNQALKPVGEVVSTLPSSEPGDGDSIAFDLLFGSGADREKIEATVPFAQISMMAPARASPALTPGTVARIAPGPRLSAPRVVRPSGPRPSRPPAPSKPRPPVPSANAPARSANVPGASANPS